MWIRPRFPVQIFRRSVSTLSPFLLGRARNIAAEHAVLTKDNAEKYDATRAKKIGELSPVTAALADWDAAQNSIKELNALLIDPVSDNELKALASQDVETTTATFPKIVANLKRSLVPPHPFASLPCLLEIHPGAGGSEASIFAESLLQMYMAFCSLRDWPYTLVKHETDASAPGSERGLTSAILEITQPASYDTLRTEAGVHRVQRVPATEKKGRTHTSAVSVLVLPSFPTTSTEPDSPFNHEDPSSDYYIAAADVRVETMRARGAGGQHVNKTDSAVRLTHIPTGTVVAMQDSRHQTKNRVDAWRILRSKMAARRREERELELMNLRRKIMGGSAAMGREDKVRTYNYAQNRVSDHRCGSDSADLPGVLGGGEALARIMSDVREWLVERDVVAVVAEEEDGARSTGK